MTQGLTGLIATPPGRVPQLGMAVAVCPRTVVVVNRVGGTGTVVLGVTPPGQTYPPGVLTLQLRAAFLALGATEDVVVTAGLLSEVPPPQEAIRTTVTNVLAARIISECRGDAMNFISNTLYNIVE